MSSLVHMKKILASRMQYFHTVEKAVCDLPFCLQQLGQVVKASLCDMWGWRITPSWKPIYFVVYFVRSGMFFCYTIWFSTLGRGNSSYTQKSELFYYLVNHSFSSHFAMNHKVEFRFASSWFEGFGFLIPIQ